MQGRRIRQVSWFQYEYELELPSFSYVYPSYLADLRIQPHSACSVGEMHNRTATRRLVVTQSRAVALLLRTKIRNSELAGCRMIGAAEGWPCIALKDELRHGAAKAATWYYQQRNCCKRAFQHCGGLSPLRGSQYIPMVISFAPRFHALSCSGAPPFRYRD